MPDYHLFCWEMAMFTSEELVFVWPIGKALLIVMVAFGVLLYAAWAGARRTLRNSGKQKFRLLQITSRRSIRSARLPRSDSAKAS
jgi:hypothetical protein